ncbi:MULTISPECIES: hypothetical protein [Elizabethkingia]|uniref:Uncharacterized protein n=2 Tax=Elizabethkingia anophelis TaxID=1117645 RepID=A0A455ZF79_9FLAO|nr:hypothetical protein [Elizabethkingia anophelis]ATC37757.1 hypothetical protein BAZ09_016570 [Elizabethkingia anophelis R26]ATC41437.1 hypothetical protein EAAG1_016785 [Elizabethkingia anophelis Ag1]ATC45114.1 hypothetical protein CMV41_16785 [Elizabethkingia anophelis]ATC48790.1 hypothetical protein CMV40_16785 [Elizabethkingia anophelis]ELR80742.1 hypothetical protein D505_02557 [Elizabethkingia anophelis R26]
MKKIEYPLTKEQEGKFNSLFERYEFYNDSNDELKFVWQPNELFNQEKFEIMKTMVDHILNEYGLLIKEYYYIPRHIAWPEEDKAFIGPNNMLFLDVKEPRLALMGDDKLSEEAHSYWYFKNLTKLFKLLRLNESLKVGDYIEFVDIDTRQLGFERDLTADCDMSFKIEWEEISIVQAENVVIKHLIYYIKMEFYPG